MNTVDMNDKQPLGVSRTIRNKVNRGFNALGNYHNDGVPINTIFNMCKGCGLYPLQEDGQEWSGFICGGHECGSEEAKKQVAIFPLAAYDDKKGYYRLTTVYLNLSWGTLYRSNGTRRWECIAYVS